MSHYQRVYSPTGEAFDVAAERAGELVLNHGWTHQPVSDELPMAGPVMVSLTPIPLSVAHMPPPQVADDLEKMIRRPVNSFKNSGGPT